ncbi:hypothetical protein ABDJ38_13055 [Aurantiacibacter sp. DGU5]|uniref:Uncharacterized protein n=2 Tax=Aurantiacibacter flavus TaxID=3145232 RepID=A0ABV0CZN0_9SPHN
MPYSSETNESLARIAPESEVMRSPIYRERLAEIAELGHAVVKLETQLQRITAQHAYAQLSQHILNMLKNAHSQLHTALSKLRTSPDRRRATKKVSMDVGLIEASGLFDTEWYLEMYPDVAESGMAPIRHLVLHGAYELRDPGPNFSAFKYHKTYPDVTEAGVPAILHYLRHGKAEGRRASKVGEGA